MRKLCSHLSSKIVQLNDQQSVDYSASSVIETLSTNLFGSHISSLMT